MTAPGARPVGLVILLFLLIPSAIYLWHYDDLPQFCDFHDDCVYYVSAKSLTDGGGYRIASLPGEPPQTKYPPLYPLLLSVAWRIDPNFPHNLPLAAWLSWLALPAVLIALSAYTVHMGIKGWRAWLLLVLFAVNPYIIWFSSQLLSELMFMALAFAAMLLIERSAERNSRMGWAVAAGLVSGVSFLARTAGIVFLVVGFLYLWLRRSDRGNPAFIKPGLFAAAMLPFVAGWAIWTRVHATPTTDLTMLYYVDYIRYQLYTVHLADLPVFVWKNVDFLLTGLGSLVLPKVTGSLLLKRLAQLIAVATISGVVRLIRRGEARLYALFAVSSLALLVVWHFPPDERFVLPQFPLALAGLLTEIEFFVGLLRAGLRHRDFSQRVVAAGMAGVAVLIFGGALALQAFVVGVFLPAHAHENRVSKVQHLAAYGWIRAHVPAGTPFMAYSDPLFNLYTGLHATRRPIHLNFWYHEDHAGIIDQWGNLKTFARDYGLKYYYFVDSDLNAPIDDQERAGIALAHRSNSYMTPVYRQGDVTIYKFGD